MPKKHLLKSEGEGQTTKAAKHAKLEHHSDGKRKAAEESGEVDTLLRAIARAISDNEAIENLGRELGFTVAECQNFIKTNYRHHEITNEGTVCMLRKWSEGVSLSSLQSDLREALMRAGLVRIAETIPMDSPLVSVSAGKQKGLTHSEVQQLKKELQKFYQCVHSNVRTSPLERESSMKLEDIYTNLAMFSRGMTGGKTNMKYNDFVKTLEDVSAERQLNNRFALFGEAGVGKTTFLAKLTLDWAAGRCLNAFDLLFLIPLREIERNTSFGDTIMDKLSDEVEFDGSRVEEYIRQNQTEVLILYDGFDEYSNDIEGYASGDDVISVLRGKKFTCSSVVVTTRPWKAEEIKSNTEVEKRYRFFEIEGFKKEDVISYISNVFPTSEEARDGLITLMTDTDSLVAENMTPYPIFCSMLCYIWKNEGSRTVLQRLETFAQLFEELINHLKDHYAGKEKSRKMQDKKLKHGEECLQQFSKDALYFLLQNKLVFGEEDLETNKDDLRTTCEIGVLTREERFVCRRENNKRKKKLVVEYRIPHKLFQEYLAGMHLASLYESNQEEFNRLNMQLMKDYRSFQYLLYFAVAQNKEVGRAVLGSLSKIRDGSHAGYDLQNFLVDVAFECHIPDALQPLTSVLNRKSHLRIFGSGHTAHGWIFVYKACCYSVLYPSRLIQPEIAKSTAYLLTHQLELKVVDETITKYPIPSNCELVDVPKVNQRIWNGLPAFSKTRDLKFQRLQNNLTRGINAYIHTVSAQNITEQQQDALALLCSANFELNSLRKEFMKPDIGYQFQHLCKPSTPVSKFLFGDDLGKQMKDIRDEHSRQYKKQRFSPYDYGRSAYGKDRSKITIRKLEFAPTVPRRGLGYISCKHNINFCTTLIYINATQNLRSPIQKRYDILLLLSSLSSKQQVSSERNVDRSSVILEAVIRRSGFFNSMNRQNVAIRQAVIIPLLTPFVALCNPFRDAGWNARIIASKPGNYSHSVKLQAYPPDRRLCVVRYLQEYIRRTRRIRASERYLFVSYKKPYHRLESIQHTEGPNISPAASKTYGTSICTMPNLRSLELDYVGIADSFFVALAASASRARLESIRHTGGPNISPAASETYATSICTMPNLRSLELNDVSIADSFFVALPASASRARLKSFRYLRGTKFSAAASKDFAKSICTIPNLQKLELQDVSIADDFFLSLATSASKARLKLIKHIGGPDISPAASQAYAKSICTMPNLLSLELKDVSMADNFFTALAASASGARLLSLQHDGGPVLSADALQDYVKCIFRMPHFKTLHEVSISPSEFKASSPSVTRGTASQVFLFVPPEWEQNRYTSSYRWQVSITPSKGSAYWETAAMAFTEMICTLPNVQTLRLHDVNMTDSFFLKLAESPSGATVP
ncbi:uncharacterized protein [Diadema setosum]|uniref:uncharacterized protein n=1 Tax=Diadema setosum TaxID=31175 RepID=UPI003B3B73B9